ETLSLYPTSSISLPGRSLPSSGEETEVITTGRHDPRVGIRATPIAEAMLALTIMDHFLRDRGQIGRR
ncbi:MAG: chorismate synthase, partial [Pseudomonadota bacterium]|nr:chorismate synthase [Pseudomonadota bacterium]